MTHVPTIGLNDSQSIPQIGLGVFQIPNDAVSSAVQAALQTGYRHIDTAAAYGNEEGVGQGIRASGVARDEIFLTTKVWNDDQGYDKTLLAIDSSLTRLNVGYVDLYLIHWPSPGRDLYAATWRALIRAREMGLARSIGVSNFEIEHLDRIIGETGVTPVLNQIEVHPRFQQRRLRQANAQRGIKTEAWSPLGRGRLLTDPVIARIAQKHERTPAQIIIRWHLDSDLIVIPKSISLARIKENFDVFGFALDANDMAAIGMLDEAAGRIGPNPMTASF
jgi:2,5-diketo-D-gluconate reductase A